jgi:endonuclease-8
MPEGDTLYRHADRLAPALCGRRVTELWLRRGDGRRFGPPRVALERYESADGLEVSDVYAVGKHLVVELDPKALRVHLGMSGQVRLVGPQDDRPWRDADVGVWLVAEDLALAVLRPPVVQYGSKKDVARALLHLGQDLLRDVDWGALAASLDEHRDRAVADVLLDQSVAAGVGNVYKNEVLFLAGVHPARTVEDVGVDGVVALFRQAASLMRENLGPGLRSTTGDRRDDERTWVHGRSGAPCRRCGAALEFLRHGALTRATWWCPTCQPFVRD